MFGIKYFTTTKAGFNMRILSQWSYRRKKRILGMK